LSDLTDRKLASGSEVNRPWPSAGAITRECARPISAHSGELPVPVVHGDFRFDALSHLPPAYRWGKGAESRSSGCDFRLAKRYILDVYLLSLYLCGPRRSPARVASRDLAHYRSDGIVQFPAPTKFARHECALTVRPDHVLGVQSPHFEIAKVGQRIGGDLLGRVSRQKSLPSGNHGVRKNRVNRSNTSPRNIDIPLIVEARYGEERQDLSTRQKVP